MKIKGYIKKEDRKKILLIGDDIRFNSGVAGVLRNIVIGTCHHFNYIILGAAINHPDKGKIFDLSEATNKEMGISDSDIKLVPCDGYGTPELIRDVIKNESPDVLMMMTDPRYFVHLFMMEHEIRSGSINGKAIPVAYLQIWDSPPFPIYNKEYWASCDLLMAISKQTEILNKGVLSLRDDIEIV